MELVRSLHEQHRGHGSTEGEAFHSDLIILNIRKFHNNTFDFKGSDAVAGGLDHIVRTANIPVEAVLVLPGQVAGVVEAVTPGLGGDFFVAFVAVGKTAGKTLGNRVSRRLGLPEDTEETRQAYAAEMEACAKEYGADVNTEIREAIFFSQSDQFWQSKIVDAKSFRRNFRQILADMRRKEP